MFKSQSIELSLTNNLDPNSSWEICKNAPFYLQDTGNSHSTKLSTPRLDSKALKYFIAGIKKSAFKNHTNIVTKRPYCPMIIKSFQIKTQRVWA